MVIPSDFELADGIYAVWVTLSGTKFRGALHWGPIPTFDDSDKSLEVFVLGADDGVLDHADLSRISVEIIKKLRDIIRFPSVDTLTTQIGKDVQEARKVLSD